MSYVTLIFYILPWLRCLSRLKLTKRMCFMPKSGFQSFFSVLTQISPLVATFGWKIFVMKNAFGGVCGKSLPKTNLTRKNPPAYGVPAVHEKVKKIKYKNKSQFSKSNKIHSIKMDIEHCLVVKFMKIALQHIASHHIRWLIKEIGICLRTWPLKHSLNIGYIWLVDFYFNTFRWICMDLMHFLHHLANYLWWQIFYIRWLRPEQAHKREKTNIKWKTNTFN